MKQMEAYAKDAGPSVVTPINLTALESNGDIKELTKAMDAVSIEERDEYQELLRKGKRLPCIICMGSNGWIKYTKCCGQPLHPLCTKKVNICPNCSFDCLTLITDVIYPERAFTLDD